MSLPSDVHVCHCIIQAPHNSENKVAPMKELQNALAYITAHKEAQTAVEGVLDLFKIWGE